jgi:hypothetical protein
MARNDDDIRVAAAAMGDLSAAAQVLYMAHLSAIRAGQNMPPSQVEALHQKVLDAAQALIETCDVPHVSESAVIAASFSE